MLGHRFIIRPQLEQNKIGKCSTCYAITTINGDVSEHWMMNELDKYQVTDWIWYGDFIDDLKENGYIRDNNQTGQIVLC